MASSSPSLSLFRSQSLPIASFLSSTSRLSRRPTLLPLFSTLSSNITLTLSPDGPDLPYGPSLRKGRRIPPAPPPAEPPAPGGDDGGGPAAIDREDFARGIDLAALRVPAEHCAALEGRLRGHLLNWPRVRNIARVPGDDVDVDLRRLLRDGGGDDERVASIVRRVRGGSDGDGDIRERLSPVLYREKLVKEFNCRGFINFRNLAKMSRPKKKKKRKEMGRGGGEARGGKGKKEFCVVEVIGDGGDEEDWSGLLGDDFVGGGKWRGPTRLLLLDERYARRSVEELPEAVKVACDTLLYCEEISYLALHRRLRLCNAG